MKQKPPLFSFGWKNKGGMIHEFIYHQGPSGPTCSSSSILFIRGSFPSWEGAYKWSQQEALHLQIPDNLFSIFLILILFTSPHDPQTHFMFLL